MNMIIHTTMTSNEPDPSHAMLMIIIILLLIYYI